MIVTQDNPKPIEPQKKAQKQKKELHDLSYLIQCLLAVLLILFVLEQVKSSRKIKLVSMDFISQRNHPRTARWDLLIRVPGRLVGEHMCVQGNIQASILYKDITLATSSIQSYNKLQAGMPHLLNVSAIASEEDLIGMLGKRIIEAIKENKEVRFGSRLVFLDCREDSEEVTMSYECDKTTLQFEPSDSDNQIKATVLVGKRPTCKLSPPKKTKFVFSFTY